MNLSDGRGETAKLTVSRLSENVLLFVNGDTGSHVKLIHFISIRSKRGSLCIRLTWVHSLIP